MYLENEICSVQICEDKTYAVDSADNKHYDIVLNPYQFKRNDLSKKFSVTIDLYYKVYKIAMIVNFYSYDINCAVLENDVLLILNG